MTVDIFIPTLTGEYINETIDSLRAQTYDDIDFHVRSDISKHKGPFRIYEKLFQETNGKFVIFFSDDDILEPNAIEEMINNIDGKNATWCLWNEFPDIENHNIHQEPNINCILWRRSFLESYIEKEGRLFPRIGRRLVDSLLIYNILGPDCKNEKAPIQKVLYHYRRHPGQTSRDMKLSRLIELSLIYPSLYLTPKDFILYSGWFMKEKMRRMVTW